MSKKNITIKLLPKKLPRNSSALAAKMMSGGGFHKNKAEKGGNTNKQVEYMKEVDDCICDEKQRVRGCPKHDPNCDRMHCSNGTTCLLGARSQGGEGCCCECAMCSGSDDMVGDDVMECTCDYSIDKGVARGCPIHDPNNRWEDC